MLCNAHMNLRSSAGAFWEGLLVNGQAPPAIGGRDYRCGAPPVPGKRANPCRFMQGLGSQATAATVRASKVWYLDYLSGALAACQPACLLRITVHLSHLPWQPTPQGCYGPRPSA